MPLFGCRGPTHVRCIREKEENQHTVLPVLPFEKVLESDAVSILVEALCQLALLLGAIQRLALS